MKIFISWSGDRSRKLAEFLSGWLRKLPLTIEPWVSKEAIDPGTRWGKELAEALEGTSFVILCITAENQKEPWINFEAGAFSKTIEKTYVVPYLIGMSAMELEQPFKQFQASEATEEGTWKLIETIYMASGDKTRSINDLNEVFQMWWPKLSEQIDNVKEKVLETGIIKKEPKLSDIKSVLDQVLIVLQSLSSRLSSIEDQSLQSLKDFFTNRLAEFLFVKSTQKGKTAMEIFSDKYLIDKEKTYNEAKRFWEINIKKEIEKNKSGEDSK